MNRPKFHCMTAVSWHCQRLQKKWNKTNKNHSKELHQAPLFSTYKGNSQYFCLKVHTRPFRGHPWPFPPTLEKVIMQSLKGKKPINYIFWAIQPLYKLPISSSLISTKKPWVKLNYYSIPKCIQDADAIICPYLT